MHKSSIITYHKQPLYLRNATPVTCLFHPARRFATRGSPGFGAQTPPATGSRAQKNRASKPESRQSPSTKSRASNEESPQTSSETKSSRRLPIGPGKILIIGVLAYLGYQVYTFQTDPHRSHILNSRNFTPFILYTRQKVSSTSSILNLLSVPKGQNTDNVTEAWRTGVWSVQAMQPELQIARFYTPLPPTVGAEPEQLRLLVRKELQGEVSTFLHRISRGTLVHLRGPKIEYAIPEDIDEIMFVAGGTGIAPALQVAHTLYSARPATSEKKPRLRILWANRRQEDSKNVLVVNAAKTSNSDGQLQGDAGLNPKPSTGEDSTAASQSQNLLVKEIELLIARHAGKVDIEYFVDDERSFITEHILRDRLGAGLDASIPEFQASKKLLLVSGPEGFVDFYAGPKSMKNGREVQGSLGGMIQKIDPQGWEIWKL